MAGITQMIKQVQHDILKRFSTTDVELLKNTEGKKIYDCTDGELKQMLAYCCLMVGIEKPPGDDKKMVLVSFLRKYHGPLTNKQVAQAFELVAAGDLGNGVQDHYNNMSPMYLSNVIRAYMQKLHGVKNRYEAKRKQVNVPQSSPEAYYKRLVKVVEEYNVIPVFWAWDEVHEYLVISRQSTVFSPEAAKIGPEEKKNAVIKYMKEKYPEAILQILNR